MHFFCKSKHSLLILKALSASVAVLVCFADWLSKAWIKSFAALGELPYNVFSHFNLVLVYNKGISFGMFSHNPPVWVNWVLPAFLVMITLVMLFWWIGAKEKVVITGLGFIIGGAIGNLIDRFVYGAVTDFLDFYVGNYHWPAFNVADSAIFIGVSLLVISNLYEVKKNEIPK